MTDQTRRPMTLAVCSCGGDLKLLVKWEAAKDDSGDALRTFLLKCEDCGVEIKATVAA